MCGMVVGYKTCDSYIAFDLRSCTVAQHP